MKRLTVRQPSRYEDEYVDVPYAFIYEDEDDEEDFFDRLSQLSPSAIIIPCTFLIFVFMFIFEDPYKAMAWWLAIMVSGFAFLGIVLVFSTGMLWLRETHKLFMALIGKRKKYYGRRMR